MVRHDRDINAQHGLRDKQQQVAVAAMSRRVPGDMGEESMAWHAHHKSGIIMAKFTMCQGPGRRHHLDLEQRQAGTATTKQHSCHIRRLFAS